MAPEYLFTSCSKATGDPVGAKSGLCPTVGTQRRSPVHATAPGAEKPTLDTAQSLGKTPESHVCSGQGSQSCPQRPLGPVLEWTRHESFLFCKHGALHLENVWEKQCKE